MFKPLSDMDAMLQAHLRYPQDLLMVQATMYGRYHLTNPPSFYIGQQRLGARPDVGDRLAGISRCRPTRSGTRCVSFPSTRSSSFPAPARPAFTAIEPLDPLSQGDRIQTLAALMTASLQLQELRAADRVRDAGRRTQPDGPAVVNSTIQSNTKISQYVTLVGRAGSTVSLGTTLIIPIDDSLVYVRPLYVSSSQNPYPQLTRYIVVYGNQVTGTCAGATLGAALADVFGAATSASGAVRARSPRRCGRCSASAQSYYKQGLAALKNEDLATYSTT